jgi:hypothetical protein
MRFNDKELALLSTRTADRDGRMYHKHLNNSSTSREGYKERWFKLIGNLLFYFKVNEYGGLCAKEPSGVFLIEDVIVQTEDEASLPFCFSLTFVTEPERKHIFSCSNQKSCDEWVDILSKASYQTLKERVNRMQQEIIEKTGSDPLSAFPHFALSNE